MVIFKKKRYLYLDLQWDYKKEILYGYNQYGYIMHIYI